MLDDNIARKAQLISDVSKEITDLIVAKNREGRADLSKAMWENSILKSS